MDAFTQKLLERTQARKEQLALKRKELDDCRASRTPPRRKPLSEDSDKQLPDRNETTSLKGKLPFKGSTTASPATKSSASISAKIEKSKVTKEADAGSPSIQARRERLIKMQLKDQENNSSITPKKHWKQLPSAKDDASSPSVATRSAVFQNKVDGQKKASEKQCTPTISKGAEIPKVSATRSIFEKGTTSSDDQSKDKNSKHQLTGPPKPPRVVDMEEKVEKDAQQSIKRKAPEPPKGKSDLTLESKPMSARTPVPRPRGEAPAIEKSEACEPVWAKRQRTGTADSTDGKGTTGGQSNEPCMAKGAPSGNKGSVKNTHPKPTPRKRGQSVEDPLAMSCSELSGSALSGSALSVSNEGTKQKSRERPCSSETRSSKKAKRDDNYSKQPIIAERQVCSEEGEEKGSSGRRRRTSKTADKPMVIQACVVSEDKAMEDSGTIRSRESVVHVQAVSSESSLEGSKKDRHSGGKRHSTRASTRTSDAVVTAVAVEDKTESKKRCESRNDESEFKMPEMPGGLSHSNLNDTMMDLNETVNLNDVDIHEITFNIDFSKFDKAMEQEKESMFKASFEDRCKKEEENCNNTRCRSKSVPDYFEPSTVPARPSSQTVQPVVKEGGVHQSGYTAASEHFAASTTPKNKKKVNKLKSAQARIQSLLEEAASQQNIVLQASQLLNCCAATNDVFRGSPEEVEAERVLLLATEHRTACLDEVQRLKTGPGKDMSEFIGSCESAVTPCMGTITISDIRLPLRQEFMDVLRLGIRSDLGVFHFVCVFRHGPSKMICSRVMSTYDATEGNFLSFPDKFVIEDLTPNFTVDVRVFCMNVKKNLPTTSTTPKHKLFQSPKVSKRFGGRKGMESCSPAIPAAASPKTVFRTSSFFLVGCTSISLPLLKSNKFSLDKVPQGCPLNCFIQLQAGCTPQYSSHVRGFLTILEDVGGYGAWQRRWCVLDGDSLQYWRYPGDETVKPPLGKIDLSSCVSESVTTVARDLCARPNTMEMTVKRTTSPPGKEATSQIKYLLAADNKTDRVTWINTLNEALKDWKAWNTATVKSKLGRVHNTDVFMCSVNSPQQV